MRTAGLICSPFRASLWGFDKDDPIMRESHHLHSRSLMARLLLAMLLLWGQVAYSAHEIDTLDPGHTHSTDCTVCFSGHFHAGTVEQAPLFTPLRAVAVAYSAYPYIDYHTDLRFGAIRAPPTHLK